VTLELTAVPLAFFAGVLGVLSPCVWPLVPVVTSSAALNGRSGPVWLALGLSLAFAGAGTALTWVLVTTGTDPEFFRYVAASLILALAALLLIPRLADGATSLLSRASARLGTGRWAQAPRATSAPGQFAVGALLGVVWLPCVGPTLGAAIGLASLGQRMSLAFVVMLAYGVGTAGVLLAAGLLSGRLLARWRPRMMAGGRFGKQLLGGTLLLLGLLVLSGVDKTLEALAVDWLPAWMFTL